MRNPSYLIRSRHNIYYFRWPVPPYLQESGRSRHIKVSLRTREPKEALRLASILEYHAYLIMQMKGIEFKALVEQDASTRLFPALSYKPNTGWGRKFGDWFNNSLLVKLGLKVKLRKTLHSLRHSFITNLSIAGVDSSYIKSLAGHEDGTVTSSVYTHFGPEHIKILKDTIEKLKY